MTVDLDALLAIERELAATGNADPYRRYLHDEARVIVPGMVLDKPACIEIMDQTPAWDELALTEAKLLRLTDEVCSIVYSFAGRRQEAAYEAVLASTYLLTEDGPKLVVHQHTPVIRG